MIKTVVSVALLFTVVFFLWELILTPLRRLKKERKRKKDQLNSTTDRTHIDNTYVLTSTTCMEDFRQITISHLICMDTVTRADTQAAGVLNNVVLGATSHSHTGGVHAALWTGTYVTYMGYEYVFKYHINVMKHISSSWSSLWMLKITNLNFHSNYTSSPDGGSNIMG